AIIAGLYVIFSSDFKFQTGLLLAIGSGLTAAIFSVINSKFIKRIPAYTITLYEMIGACVGTFLFFPLYKILWAEGNTLQLTPTAMDWMYIAVLAIVCSVYAYSVSVELMKRLSVFFIQLTFSLEPVYGIVMALIIFGAKEQMGLNFYLGAGVIVVSVIVYPYLKTMFYRSHS
ncbi:MAG: DMT family transporter, partial [Cyclobacteriaceae bacterium]